MVKAFYVSECELWAAETAEQAKQDYERETGEECIDGYPQELTDAELDAELPEFDEDEAQTGGKTSVRQMLSEFAYGVGFLACSDW